MNLPDFILLEQTGKDKGLPLFTCYTSGVDYLYTSIKTVKRERTGWMKNQNIVNSDEAF